MCKATYWNGGSSSTLESHVLQKKFLFVRSDRVQFWMFQ